MTFVHASVACVGKLDVFIDVQCDPLSSEKRKLVAKLMPPNRAVVKVAVRVLLSPWLLVTTTLIVWIPGTSSCQLKTPPKPVRSGALGKLFWTSARDEQQVTSIVGVPSIETGTTGLIVAPGEVEKAQPWMSATPAFVVLLSAGSSR